MKILTALVFAFPFLAHANFDGVYHNTYQKNGYDCEFNADITQKDSTSMTLTKWNTHCESDSGDHNIDINGPMTFKLLADHKVEISTPDDVNVYETTKGSLSDKAFHLNYNFEAYVEGTVLKYDIFMNFALENDVLNYDIHYTQNDQLIFQDSGSGQKVQKTN